MNEAPSPEREIDAAIARAMGMGSTPEPLELSRVVKGFVDQDGQSYRTRNIMKLVSGGVDLDQAKVGERIQQLLNWKD